MAVVYSDSFANDTVGSIAPGWANAIGTWQVKANNFDGTTNAFTDVSNAANDVAVASAIAGGAIANMVVQYDVTVGTGTNQDSFMYPVLRADSASYQNAYLLTQVAGSTSQFQWFKRTAGTYSAIGTAFALGNGYSLTPGDIVTVNAFVSNSTLGVAIWKKSAAAPTTYSGTTTDTSVTAAGYAGLYYGQGNVAQASGLAVANYVVDNAPTPTAVKVLSVAGAALALGAATVTAQTPASATITATAPTGGTPPYAYQWYRSTAYAFTPSAATLVTGATGLTLNDTTAVVGTRYTYALVATDSVGATSTSTYAWADDPSAAPVFGFIGDSITRGLMTTVVSTPQAMINELGSLIAPVRPVLGSNQGVSGTTTSDWTLGTNTNGANLANAVTALAAAACTVVVITLGTNDTRTDRAIPTATSISNLRAIIAYVQSQIAGVKIVVNVPPFLDFQRFGAPYAASSGTALDALAAAIPALAGTNVFIGDTSAISLFANNETTILADGLHPNDVGAPILGALWAQAAAKALGYVMTAAGMVASGLATGTKYPASGSITAVANGAPQVAFPWTIPAFGAAGATGVPQAGTTTFTVSAAPNAARELGDLMDRMVRDGRAVVT